MKAKSAGEMMDEAARQHKAMEAEFGRDYWKTMDAHEIAGWLRSNAHRWKKN